METTPATPLNPSPSPRSANSHLQAIDRDRFALGFPGERHHLSVAIGCDLILVRNLVNLPLLGHQHKLVSVPNASCDTLRVVPHSFTALRAREIDDIPR